MVMQPPPNSSVQTVNSTESIWNLALYAAGCEFCDSTFLVTAADLNAGLPCLNCGQQTLTPQPARLRTEAPEKLVPFRLSSAQARTALETFVKGLRYKPGDFNLPTLTQRLKPIYLPMWLIDADVFGAWQADLGFDYEVKSSRESYAAGGWQTQEVIETRIRWEPRAGQIIRHYDNIAVPALSDHDVLSKLIGPFSLNLAQDYDPVQLAGAGVRVPNLRREHAWPLAQPRLNDAAAHDCQTAGDAQHIRDYAIQASYDNQHWTQLLLPMYVTWYTDDDGERHTLYINGETGQVSGPRLASQKKANTFGCGVAIAAAVVFGLGAILTLAGLLFPPIAILGVPLMLIGFAIAIVAIFPFVGPRRWNKRERDSLAYRRIHTPVTPR